MPSESGIGITGELSKYIGEVKTSTTRAFKVIISDEKLLFEGEYKNSTTFENDFDPAVKGFVQESKPCYIMIRFDHKNEEGFSEWLLVFYCPDSSTVREKMTFASTRSAFKRDFGSNLVPDELFVTKKDDVCYKYYQEHVRMKTVSTPLTDMEIFQQESKAGENNFVGIDSTGSKIPGMTLNVDPEISQALNDFKSGKSNYIQLSIDVDTEKVRIKHNKMIKLSQIEEYKCEDEPRFHFLRFEYQHDGESKTAMIFIYSIPGFKSSIKQRMVYSSCKSFVAGLYEDQTSKFDKKLELDDISSVDNDFLINEIHPKQEVKTAAFSKPKRPGRK